MSGPPWLCECAFFFGGGGGGGLQHLQNMFYKALTETVESKQNIDNINLCTCSCDLSQYRHVIHCFKTLQTVSCCYSFFLKFFFFMYFRFLSTKLLWSHLIQCNTFPGPSQKTSPSSEGNIQGMNAIPTNCNFHKIHQLVAIKFQDLSSSFFLLSFFVG